MWKRWSIKSHTSFTEYNKAKQQTSLTTDPLVGGPTNPLAIGFKDANTNSTVQETVLDSQEKTDNVAVGHVIPIQVPVPQNTVNDTVRQSTAPASYSKTSSAEFPDSVPSNACVSPGITTPPSTITRADRAEPPSSLLKSMPVNIGTISSGTPGNVDDTPTSPNTLLPPGPESPNRSTRIRRLSFRSFAFFYGHDKQPPPTPGSQTQKHSDSSPPPQPKLSRAEKEALSSAIALRLLMVGPSSLPSSSENSIHPRKSNSRRFKSTGPPPSPNLNKVKAQLLKPEHANAIISQLRRLPLPDGPSFHVSNRASSESLVTHLDVGGMPIHAVCLACTDEEAEEKHFSRLRTGHNLLSPSSLTPDAMPTAFSSSSPNVGTASLESLVPVLKDLQLVSLLESPDLGFGHPVSSDERSGIFTGSVPSPSTLLDGFEEITKQLMNLGFTTSKAIFPSHVGIYPPRDRMSILTYWWGLELVLPEPSILYLGKVKSISNTLLNFLSALALFNNGVREALPFVRYVSNFVNFEWSSIQAQDKGQGVVCAATWVMPAAMVPRPWDFPSRPETSPRSPTAPTSPAAPKTSAGDGDKATEGTEAPTQPPFEDSRASDVLYPAAPALSMMPQLMVTPATLPRNFLIPQQAGGDLQA